MVTFLVFGWQALWVALCAFDGELCGLSVWW